MGLIGIVSLICGFGLGCTTGLKGGPIYQWTGPLAGILGYGGILLMFLGNRRLRLPPASPSKNSLPSQYSERMSLPSFLKEK